MNQLFSIFTKSKNKNTNDNNIKKSNFVRPVKKNSSYFYKNIYSDSQVNYSTIPEDGENEVFFEDHELKSGYNISKKYNIEGKTEHNIKHFDNLNAYNYKSYSLKRLLFSMKKSKSYPLHIPKKIYHHVSDSSINLPLVKLIEYNDEKKPLLSNKDDSNLEIGLIEKKKKLKEFGVLYPIIFNSFKEYIYDINNIERDLHSKEIDELNELITNKNEHFERIYFLSNTNEHNLYENICDKDNHYICIENDHIFYRYKLSKILGKGCYGKVIKCKDYKSGSNCAIKIIKSEKSFYYSFLSETKMLFRLQKYKNNAIINNHDVKGLFTEPLNSFFWRNHGCIVMPIYPFDLFKAKLGRIPREKLKIIYTDIIDALIFLKYCKVVHLDLKPENIFLKSKDSYNCVIGDFGLARTIKNNLKLDSFYVQTCWYRSPEVVLKIPYDYGADLWSAGVIFIELLIDKPAFRAYSDIDLFICFQYFIKKKPNYLKNNNKTIETYFLNKGKYKLQSFKLHDRLDHILELLRIYQFDKFNDLMIGILKWDYTKRITLEKAKEIINEF